MKKNNILQILALLFLLLPVSVVAMEQEDISDRIAKHSAEEQKEERKFLEKMIKQEAKGQEQVQHFLVGIAETLIAQENAKERFVDDMAACLDEKEVKKSLKKKK